MSSVIAANCLSTVTACSAPWRTPRTRCRRRCFVPGGIATASRKARRCAHGTTAWLRTPASKVCLRCGSQHRPKHFDEGTYTVVTHCDSDLRDRFLLCQHLKGSKQPRLLSPTAKGHACLSQKRTHESTASHSGKMRPVVQRAVISNIIQQSIRNSGQSFFSWYGQTQGLLVRLSNLITKRCDQVLLRRVERLAEVPINHSMNYGE